MYLKLIAAIAVSSVAVPASAATFEVRSGTDQRALQINYYSPAGQTFTATDTNLTSFGFRIDVLNSGSPETDVTLTIRSGTGNTGAVIASKTVTPTGVPTARNTASWVDFALSGATLVTGQTYTALLDSPNVRYGVTFGPDIDIYSSAPQGVDAYAGGSLFAPKFSNDATCNAGRCDANFRFTADTPASAVPETSTWAMLVVGFGSVGGALRRRRRVSTAFA